MSELPAWAPELQTVRMSDPSPGVLVVILNRPEAANSRNQRMRNELARIWEWVPSATSVRAVVLSGAGEKYFCTGMDLKEAGHPETPMETRTRLLRSRDIEALAALPIPTVAAINGYAVGGGLEMALACDLRVAREGALVGLPEVKSGLVPAGGATQRLPRIIGPTLAAELILTGRLLEADEALSSGLLNRVCGPSDLLRTAIDLAEQASAHPSAAVAAAKELLRRNGEEPMSAAIGRELDVLVLLLANKHHSAYHNND